MPKAKPISLSGLIDTDMEEDALNAHTVPTADSNQENAGAPKMKGTRSKANARKTTKPKRLSGSSAGPRITAPRAKARKRRVPLKEQANNGHAVDMEEVDGFATQTEGEGKATAGETVETRSVAKGKAPGKKTGRPAKAHATKHVHPIENDGEFEYTPTTLRRNKLAEAFKKGEDKTSMQKAVAEDKPESEIQEMQVSMDVDTSAVQEDDEEDIAQSVSRQSNNARVTARQRQPLLARRRAGSASSTERGPGDPALRRKLGEMTRKFENVELKYRNLRDAACKEAEANFDRLKEQSEAKARAADKLIASLKKEIATQKAIAQESRSVQKLLHARDAELATTRALADQVSTSLAEAQNENKILQTKLANSRSASVTVETLGCRTPGSAMKGKSQAQARTISVSSAEAALAAQTAQLKEDLYSDLTGLILRGVDIGTNVDTYDCIQTGRNGTLHFKLAIAKETDDSYENTEFQYAPRLDSNRDRDLITLLPEYLTEEITFSRTNAAMFYGRVFETLTKRRLAEAEE
ncbi:MAG: hypothetical protein Q9163_001775 [Psora crenata]